MTSEIETSQQSNSPPPDQDKKEKEGGFTHQEYAEQAENYRVQRNKALRQAHAFKTMLKAHGIDLKPVTDKALEHLPINQGAVDGVFDYKAPDIKVPPAPAQTRVESSAPPTLDEVRRWSPEKINAQWDTVKELMKKGKNR